MYWGGGGLVLLNSFLPLVFSLFSSAFPSACREVTALFQTEHSLRLKNRSFSSDSGNLLSMRLADVVQYMEMLICVCAHKFIHIGISLQET